MITSDSTKRNNIIKKVVIGIVIALAVVAVGGNVNVSGGQSAAGIGSGYSYSTCGAISINGGTVAATGGDNGAGIGTGFNSSSGAITISGGTVTATGNGRGSGIGTGFNGTCEDGVTIANTVTRVTATKGSSAPNSIGAGFGGTCGTVTIGGDEGAISTSPYTYKPLLELHIGYATIYYEEGETWGDAIDNHKSYNDLWETSDGHVYYDGRSLRDGSGYDVPEDMSIYPDPGYHFL